MSATADPVLFTETEIRSYLPSGWGIVAGASGRWEAKKGSWSVDVYDGADNVWRIEVLATAAAKSGRLEALRGAIDRVQRKGLGRKSILLG